jgi:hypothetical protein
MERIENGDLEEGSDGYDSYLEEEKKLDTVREGTEPNGMTTDGK